MSRWWETAEAARAHSDIQLPDPRWWPILDGPDPSEYADLDDTRRSST